ncbi:hypothetical protein RBSH_01062 [Rhodopirellula baltica SH28]|uniref:Uncharacterized protein n=1 Tax=Rhodopirellula baltica SH28 TaxID=993517 RepID=K5DMB9_RHOBT|nr:hypothetical protein RBSH_01062 [Rhodopirellula baltica SH28]
MARRLRVILQRKSSQSDSFFRDLQTSKVPISFGMLPLKFDRTSNGSSR